MLEIKNNWESGIQKQCDSLKCMYRKDPFYHCHVKIFGNHIVISFESELTTKDAYFRVTHPEINIP